MTAEMAVFAGKIVSVIVEWDRMSLDNQRSRSLDDNADIHILRLMCAGHAAIWFVISLVWQ